MLIGKGFINSSNCSLGYKNFLYFEILQTIMKILGINFCRTNKLNSNCKKIIFQTCLAVGAYFMVDISYIGRHNSNSAFFYGVFLSYISLVSITANLTLGKLTDKLQKRVLFLYPLTIIMALVTFTFPFATKNITHWIIVTGIIGFLLPLFWNVSTALLFRSIEMYALRGFFSLRPL